MLGQQSKSVCMIQPSLILFRQALYIVPCYICSCCQGGYHGYQVTRGYHHHASAKCIILCILPKLITMAGKKICSNVRCMYLPIAIGHTVPSSELALICSCHLSNTYATQPCRASTVRCDIADKHEPYSANAYCL